MIKNIIYVTDTINAPLGGVVKSMNIVSKYIKENKDINIYSISKSDLRDRCDYDIIFKNNVLISDKEGIYNIFDKLDPSDSIIICAKIPMMHELYQAVPTICFRYPVLLEYYGNAENCFKTWNWFRNYFVSFYFGKGIVNHVRTLTEFDKQVFEKSFNNVSSLYVPIEKKEIIKQEKYTKNKIIFVGRIEEASKNITGLISTFNKINAANKNLEFHIYGAGPDENLLKEIDNEKFIFHGMTSDKDAIYSDANILISTSHKEGIPMVVVESICRGIPVITLESNKGLYSILGDHNLVFPHSKTDEFIDRILEVAENEDERNTISKNLFDIASEFELSNNVEKYLEIMDETIDNFNSSKIKNIAKNDSIIANLINSNNDLNNKIKERSNQKVGMIRRVINKWK